VSDGLHAVATDTDGRYRLPASDAPSVVWFCVPRDRAASGPFWRAVGDGQTADFGLVDRRQSDDFVFAQITDTHVGRADLVQQLGAHLATFPVPPAFVVNTGDLVAGVDTVAPDKAKPQFDRYLAAAATFPMPLFNLPGNHEHVGFNRPNPETAHPFYGKGLYRTLLGPTYYSWDWAGVHAVALDGTSLPYQERLGAEQLTWLAADLALQPLDKPLLLFCHQPLYALKDAKDVAAVLRGRRVLGAFCGHLHRTFDTTFAGVPLYQSGATSGAWWSGPNIDGTPQGFRFAQVKGGALKTVYVGREGKTPLSAVSPLASAVLTNDFEAEFALLDFGRPADLSAAFDGHPVAFSLASREALWSFWKARVSLDGVSDGDRVLHVEARQGTDSSTNEIRYLVDVGRPPPYRAGAAATLSLQVRAVGAACAVAVNGRPVGEISAGTADETTLSFPVPQELLQKLNRVNFQVADAVHGRQALSVGPVWLAYKGRKIHDLRYASFERHAVSGDPRYAFHALYYCLP
jgi:predicted MPP superfamily phosphohydrolase